MKRIRIGNDIRVQTTLHELNDFDSTAVKLVICYFIPSDEIVQEQPKTYDPSQYNICNCGKPVYNVFPCNADAPHWFCGYNGFGVNSTPFICTKNKYVALARALKEQNRIEAYFPAKELKLIGLYKVVFVVVMYQDGWNQDNLRTYTIDKGTVFSLTTNNDDITSDTIINLDSPYIVKMEVPKSLNITGETFKIGLSADDIKYLVTLTYSNGTTTIIDTPSKYTDIITSIHNVSGGISVNSTGDIIRNFDDKCEAYITYVLQSNPEILAEIHVTTKSIFYNIDYELEDGITLSEGSDRIEVEDDCPDDTAVLQFTLAFTQQIKDIDVVVNNAAKITCDYKLDTFRNYTIYTPVADDITITAKVTEWTSGEKPNPDFGE